MNKNLEETIKSGLKRRDWLLLELWELINGKIYKSFDFFETARKLGFSDVEIENSYLYFAEEEVIQTDLGGIAKFTPKAINKIENVIEGIDQSNENLSSTVIQNFYASVGVV